MHAHAHSTITRSEMMVISLISHVLHAIDRHL